MFRFRSVREYAAETGGLLSGNIEWGEADVLRRQPELLRLRACRRHRLSRASRPRNQPLICRPGLHDTVSDPSSACLEKRRAPMGGGVDRPRDWESRRSPADGKGSVDRCSAVGYHAGSHSVRLDCAGPCRPSAADRHAIGQARSVHRPGRGGADARNIGAFLLQRAVLAYRPARRTRSPTFPISA